MQKYRSEGLSVLLWECDVLMPRAERCCVLQSFGLHSISNSNERYGAVSLSWQLSLPL